MTHVNRLTIVLSLDEQHKSISNFRRILMFFGKSFDCWTKAKILKRILCEDKRWNPHRSRSQVNRSQRVRKVVEHQNSGLFCETEFESQLTSAIQRLIFPFQPSTDTPRSQKEKGMQYTRSTNCRRSLGSGAQ